MGWKDGKSIFLTLPNKNEDTNDEAHDKVVQ